MILSRIAFRSALKNWRKSLAAIVSVAAGFTSYVLFQGYVVDVDDVNVDNYIYRGMNGHAIIENMTLHKAEGRSKPEEFWITKEHQDKIENFLKSRPEVVTRVRFITTNGMVSNGENSAIFIALAHDVKEGEIVRGQKWSWDTIYGLPFHKNENKETVLLGQALGTLMNCVPESVQFVSQSEGYKPENRPFNCTNSSLQLTATTEAGQLNALDLEVSGIVDSGFKAIDSKWVVMSLESAQALLDTDKIRYYSVLFQSEDQLDEFAKAFDDFTKAEGLPYQVTSWRKHPIAEMFVQIQDLLNIFQAFIVTVIVVISGLSVLNTMLKAVKERTREIGTLRSIGFTGSQMSLIFSLEACYLSLMGVLVGSVFSVIATLIINKSSIYYKGGFLSQPVLFKIAISPNAYIVCALLLMVLAVLTSYFASRSIAKSTVAENLIHV